MRKYKIENQNVEEKCICDAHAQFFQSFLYNLNVYHPTNMCLFKIKKIQLL